MKKNLKKDLVAYVVRSPRIFIEQLNKYVYTEGIRSRNHLVNIAIKQWIDIKEKNKDALDKTDFKSHHRCSAHH